MAENIIMPDTPKEGVRRSNRTRFKSWRANPMDMVCIHPISHNMLTDDMIKKGDFGFGQFQINKPPSLGKGTKTVLDRKTARDRDPKQKKKPKSSKKLNDTAADFKYISDDGMFSHINYII